MSERDDLLDSVASEIKTYRKGILPEPTPEHVDRWLFQFTPCQQLPFLREFDHVMKKTFITLDGIKGFLRQLVKNEQLTGNMPTPYWSAANFLKIQNNGQSQKEMIKIFSQCLEEETGLKLSECGKEGGDFIYLDDLMFSGSRICNDLESWIMENSPQSATIHVIVVATHSWGEYIVREKIKRVIEQSRKKIVVNYWRSVEIENRKFYKNNSAVLWPTMIPNIAEVKAYMAQPTRFPFDPRQPSTTLIPPFSSEAGRQILESEFFIAGARIRAMSDNPKQSMRPLGFSPFSVGFGSMLVTYRNCPNNCPLAMWWGDPNVNSGALHWYPLLQREGYYSRENNLDDFTF